MDALAKAGVPLPTSLIRDYALHGEWQRTLSAATLSSLFDYSRRTWRRHSTPHFVCAALHLDGRRYRGWFALAEWSTANRIIPSIYLATATRRAGAALRGDPPPSWERQAAIEIEIARQRLDDAPLTERYFGRESPY